MSVAEERLGSDIRCVVMTVDPIEFNLVLTVCLRGPGGRSLQLSKVRVVGGAV